MQKQFIYLILLFIAQTAQGAKKDDCFSYLEMIKNVKVSEKLHHKLRENIETIEVAFKVPKNLSLDETMFYVSSNPVPFRGGLGYVRKEKENVVLLKGSRKDIIQSLMCPPSEEVEFYLSSELIDSTK